MTDSISIHVVSAAGGPRVTLTVSSDITVAQFKQQLSAQNEVPVDELRLIYRGRILKDPDTLTTCGVTAGCVFHLARRPRQSAPSPTTAQTPTAVTSPPPVPPSTPQANPFSSLLTGQMPEGTNRVQEAVMQSMANNPDLIQSFMQNNPAVQQLMEQNPELAQVMNNPELIRESLRLLSNPNLMQEHMRNVDRAMSNLESMPGGFNALRQIYENVQEPLMNATQDRAQSDNPFAALFNQPPGTRSPNSATVPPPTSGTINTQPLPNPWAPPASSPPSTVPTTGSNGAPGLQLPDGMNPEQMHEMMQSPAVQQMLRSLLSNPGFVDSLSEALPGMREELNTNPVAREMLSNPELLQNVMNPDNLQAMRQLQQSLQTLQRGGLGPMLNLPEDNTLASLLGSLPSTQPSVADPETAYATQLQQLQEMGFYDRAANVRALQATGGNVHAAVERLLSQL